MPRAPRLAVLTLLAAATLAGCATPEEKVAAARRNYEATLQSFLVRRPEPPPPPAPVAGEAAGETAVAPDATPGVVTETVQELPTTVAVLLDVLVRHTGGDRLAGFTLDVEQVDPARLPKHTWRVWVDTSALGPGPGTQVSQLLEGVDYEEGDGFSVQVRANVPPGDRDEYREFGEAAGGAR